jgi:hypothetical protein
MLSRYFRAPSASWTMHRGARLSERTQRQGESNCHSGYPSSIISACMQYPLLGDGFYNVFAFGHDQRSHPAQDACMTLGPDTLGGAPEQRTALSQYLDHIHTIKTACHGRIHTFGRSLAPCFRRGRFTVLTVRGGLSKTLLFSSFFWMLITAYKESRCITLLPNHPGRHSLYFTTLNWLIHNTDSLSPVSDNTQT